MDRNNPAAASRLTEQTTLEIPAGDVLPPSHGGDVYHLARALGVPLQDLVDFSANINPLGFPPGIMPAVREALGEIVHYPDRRCWDLRQDLAAYHGLSPEEILVGNGSTELIYLLARVLAPKQALIVAPAFSEYEHALNAAGIPVEFYFTPESAYFTPDALPPLKDTGVVFLANPASPSGALAPSEVLLSLAASLERTGGWLVLDEAFIDFVEEHSLKAMLRQFPRLVILRSFTKFFGIPGIRLGYLLAAPGLVQQLAGRQEPWSVNTLAQTVGRACLREERYMAETRALVAREREFLLESLSAISGLKVFPGAVNYLLVKITQPAWTAARLRQALLPHHLIIRDASNFPGLDQRFFRLAVRRREDNARLVEALGQCLGQES